MEHGNETGTASFERAERKNTWNLATTANSGYLEWQEDLLKYYKEKLGK